MRYFLVFLLLLSFRYTKAQNNKANFELEIINANIGLYGATYSTRSEGIKKMGEEFGFFSQVYFPFQWAVDYESNFNDSLSYQGEYNDRLFLIRPQFLFSVTQQSNVTAGLSIQFSWLLFHQFYIEYASGVVWVEAKKSATDGLSSGFNLNQTLSISQPINNHFTFSLGFNHLSNAHISNSEANQDVLYLGLKYIF